MNNDRSQIVRFGVVGVLNTAVDFALFYVLTALVDINFIAANVMSTGVALCLSYALHARFTFAAKTGAKSAAYFVAVTLTGLWLLQPLIIAATAPLMTAILTDDIALMAAKLLATIASLIWNYVLYKLVVFKQIHNK